MTEAHRRKRRPDSLDEAACTCANLRKAARVMTQLYDTALQPVGLKATQFNVLANLSRLGDVPLTRLADALVMERTTLTRNLRPLERRGLVRIGNDDDQRVRRIALSEAGARLLEDARPLWKQAQSGIVRRLGAARWSRLIDDLSVAVAAAQHA